MNKPYPVGTSIKYLGGCTQCNGKTGKVVEVHRLHCYITLPQSKCSALNMRSKIIAGWNDIELLVKKNQQLLFSFMEEQDA